MWVQSFLRCKAAKMADPLIHNVPVFCQRPVGRDTNVLNMWQNLLSGKRVQVLTGLDGIGKSTLASQFCECARKSGRFTCIQWFNAEYALEDQLTEFMRGMKDRSEKEVLLVFDDVADLPLAAKLIPKHASICSLVIAQSSTKKGAQTGEGNPPPGFSEFAVGPLLASAAQELAAGITSNSEANDDEQAVSCLMRDLGNVPLLIVLADALVGHAMVSPKVVSGELRGSGAVSDVSLSVSEACGVLVKLALRHLGTEFKSAHTALALIAALHISDISPALLDGAAGGCTSSSSEFARKTEELGLLTHKWETDSYALHRLVAQTLLTTLDKGAQAAVLGDAARLIHSLWPRRTRSAGSAVAEGLVWHSLALRNTFVTLGVDFTVELLTVLDRSATYLAQVEGRHLNAAVDMWESVVDRYAAMNIVSGAQVEAAWNCGRLQHFLRRPEAGATLKHAFDTACAVQGRSSIEAALILSCYSPYLEAGQTAGQLLLDAAKTLEERTAVAATSSTAETKMMKEAAVVLLLRISQVCRERGEEVPVGIQPRLDKLRQDLLQIK